MCKGSERTTLPTGRSADPVKFAVTSVPIQGAVKVRSTPAPAYDKAPLDHVLTHNCLLAGPPPWRFSVIWDKAEQCARVRGPEAEVVLSWGRAQPARWHCHWLNAGA